MDYTILIIIIVVVSVIALTYLAMYLRVKNVIKSDDLMFAVSLLGLSVAIIDQLNLEQEDKIKDISLIVANVVNYVAVTMSEDINRTEVAYECAIKLCQDLDMELTDERKRIIKQLIEISFSKL